MQQQKRANQLLIWVQAQKRALFVLLLILILTVAFAPFTWHFPTMQGITVDLATDGEHLIIKNGNDFIWENATITVNHQYRYQVELFPRGGTNIPLSEFVNGTGDRLDPFENSLRAVTIQVPKIYNGQVGYFEW